MSRLRDLVREVWERLTEVQECAHECCAGDVYGETGPDHVREDLP